MFSMSLSIELGSTVTVQSRMWPGINKPGGVARVTKINKDKTYDVTFVLGGRERNVDAEYVTKHQPKLDSSLKRAAAPKPGEFAAPNSKRRKSNGNTNENGNQNEEEDEPEEEEEEAQEEQEGDDTTGSDSHSSSDDTIADGLYKVGDLVVVEPRLWPGINKPGGVGRIQKCNGKKKTVNVRYILGGIDKDIDLEYVQPEKQHENGETRSSKKSREKKRGSDGESSTPSSPSSSSSASSSPSISSSKKASGNQSAVRNNNTSNKNQKQSKSHLKTKEQTKIINRSPEEVKRSPVAHVGYMTYTPDLNRFEMVRKVVAKMWKEKKISTASVNMILETCQEALMKSRKGSSSSSSSSSSSGSSSSGNTEVSNFELDEIRGHLDAMEPDGDIFFVRKKGMVYQIEN